MNSGAGRGSSETRARVVEALCDTIAARGVERTRFTDVATCAGVSVGNLQYLFGSREAMVLAGLEHATQELLSAVVAKAAEMERPVERLRWVATHLAAGVQGDEESARREWLLWTEYWRAALRDEELRLASLAMYEAWVGVVRDAILDCVRTGAVAEPADVDLIAAGAVAMGDGLGVQVALGRPSLDWNAAGGSVRLWLSLALQCPELA